ncbi:MAG: hypothetical protein WA755_20055 [Candidatus Acidiferrales bacterium]
MKLAMFAWWTHVESNHIRTKFGLNDDPRVMAGVAAIIEHAAFRIGMKEDRGRALVRATNEACREALPTLNGHHPLLQMICQDYDDRIEITLESPGGVRSATEAFVAMLKKQVDRVTAETHGGALHLTLVEYIRAETR